MIRLVSLLAVCALIAPLHAEEAYAFFSSNAREPATGKPSDPAGDLRLRANNEMAYHVYVHNPGVAARENLTVVLAADEKGDRLLAEGVVAKVDANATVPVRLVAKAPLIPPPEKSTSAPASSLPSKVYLFIVRATATNPRTLLGEVKSHTVTIMSPKNYLYSDPRTPSGVQPGSGDLYVRFTDLGQNSNPPKNLIHGKAVPLFLNIRADLLDSIDPSTPLTGSTLAAEVAPGAKDVTLLAKNLKFLNKSGASNYFSVDADGVSNAFVFKLDINGTTPTPVDEKGGFLRAFLPRYAIPGKPIETRFEIFGDNPTGTPIWKFVRVDERNAETLISEKRLPAPRFEKTSFRIGSEGEILVVSEVRDWLDDIKTAGLSGNFKLRFELQGNSNFKAAETLMTLDPTAPKGVDFVNAPQKIEKGQTLTVSAKAEDGESGIDSVWFYLGELTDKPAPGTTQKGVRNKEGNWTATFELIDPKAKIEVGVRATNKAGMHEDKRIVVAVTAPSVGSDSKKPDTGTIEGRVIQGDDRAQPNLEVVLKDPEGKAVATTKTNAKGEFKFEKVKPGNYAVYSAKPIDYAKGEVKVAVVAGETAKPTISVKR